MNPFTLKPFSETYQKLLETRKTLPVYVQRNEIIKLVKENQVTVIVGETGSGKTTQIPQILLQDLVLLLSLNASPSDPNTTAAASAGTLQTNDEPQPVNRNNSNNSNSNAKPRKGTKIAVTQPRRLAATSVADRVSKEMDVTLGTHVGYSVRFDQKNDESTKIKFLTDGMLLREAMTDHSLSEYGMIIIDEAHERTLASDIMMGLLKRLCQSRPYGSLNPLRVVIMSATLDADTFSKYYWNAPMLLIPGRTYPVDIVYTPEPVSDYVEATVDKIMEIIREEPEGDILAFLTGQDEIDDVCKKVRRIASQLYTAHEKVGEIAVIPLYSSLSPQAQQRVFQLAPKNGPGNKIGRKVIVSTNIAETSLTVDGVVYVVDCGLSKQNVFDPRLNAESLLPSPISKASAQQRAGRAGRTRPGKCFRLYTESSFAKEMKDHTHPAIVTSNIASVVLLLKRIGVDDFVRFDYLTAPAPETMMRALELLFHLKALTQDLRLTNRGKMMSEFPLDPALSAFLINALESCQNRLNQFKDRRNLINAILTIVAMLSVPPPWVRTNPKEADRAHSRFHQKFGDHFMLMSLFDAYANTKHILPSKFKQQDQKPEQNDEGDDDDDQIDYAAKNAMNQEDQKSKKVGKASFVYSQQTASSSFSPVNFTTVYKKDRSQPAPETIEDWCFQNYINYRSLQSAWSVRKQLAGILMHCCALLDKRNEILDDNFAVPVSVDDDDDDENNNLAKLLSSCIVKEYSKPVDRLSDFVCKEIVICLVSAFFLNIAKRSDGTFYDTLVDPHKVLLHPSCCLMKNNKSGGTSIYNQNNRNKSSKNWKKGKFQSTPNNNQHDEYDLYSNVDLDWIIYHEHVVTRKHYLRTVTVIPDKNIFYRFVPKDWLIQITSTSNTAIGHSQTLMNVDDVEDMDISNTGIATNGNKNKKNKGSKPKSR